ncbi:hypothetical protein NsoK4_01715 [Nitrosopumilus sp. K4]|uniref:tetratricopeptide repeat protein n=1 Tax=Nitrosopumilus sp. K4 TaxID=2795383 RepID=UPI001BA841F2|nr:hypothetical protein [Nitrosopumilus sp. K4]QUC65018.1 hypothetical protein NsoK4_01715 [Nitrosopumilus sp. K4]
MRKLCCSESLDNVDEIKKFIEFFLSEEYIKTQTVLYDKIKNKQFAQIDIPKKIHPIIPILEFIQYLIQKNPETIDEKFQNRIPDLMDLSFVTKDAWAYTKGDLNKFLNPSYLKEARSRFKDLEAYRRLMYEFKIAGMMRRLGEKADFEHNMDKKWPDLKTGNVETTYVECKKLEGPDHIFKIQIANNIVKQLNKFQKNGIVNISSKKFPSKPDQIEIISKLVEVILKSEKTKLAEEGITVTFTALEQKTIGEKMFFPNDQPFEYMISGIQFQKTNEGIIWREPRAVTIHSDDIPTPLTSIKHQIAKAYKQLKNVSDEFYRVLCIDISEYVNVVYVKAKNEHENIIESCKRFIMDIFEKGHYSKLGGIILSYTLTSIQPNQLGAMFKPELIVNAKSIKPISKYFLYPAYHEHKTNFDMGMKLASEGKVKESIPYFEKSTKLQPKIKEGWMNLAISQRDSGLVVESIQSFQKAIELDKKLIPAYTGLSDSYARLRMNGTSIETLDKILEFEPKHAQTWYNKAGMYAHMADFENAKRCALQCLEIDPNYQNAIDLLNRLG